MVPLRGELRAFAGRMGSLGLVLLALVGLGTVGFGLTEHESAWQAFNRALDVIATTGSIPAPTDTGGQVVKVLLTLLGVGTLFYALVTVAEFFVAGHVAHLLADRRSSRMLAGLTDHHIVCGFGRVGRQVARDLRAAGARYVVIDPDPGNVESAQAQVGVRAILGQPSDDESLRQAGIERAKAIVACVDSDAENIFICLTARQLRPDIAIVARASLERLERSLGDDQRGRSDYVGHVRLSGINHLHALEVAEAQRREVLALGEHHQRRAGLAPARQGLGGALGGG